ncbi:MAG: catechol 2,3-dioxygenase, partial [Thermomicrobium sp.]|nr:catechol 2,3-dioxygenase [Thermomicrobium sp.]MDW8007425.1 catechol 2,3-dioxygenase [Thermomicrobium sp.]
MNDVTLYIGEPSFDMAHLAHLELTTPVLEESVRFFVEYMGMYVTEQRGNSVYLRGWDDYAH